MFSTVVTVLFGLSIIFDCGQSTSVASNGAIKPPMTIEEAQANFALNLLKAASNANESAVLSPFSLAVALSMAYAGAEDNTKTQMAEVLANGLNSTEIHQYFEQLLKDIAGKAQSYILESASRLYMQEGYALKQAFMDLIGSKYGGQFQQVNFSDAERVAAKINDWVEQQTNDKIRDLISSSSLDSATRLILINAVYFKGLWEDQFDKELTKNETFHVSESEEKQVEMMHKKAYYNYTANDEVQVLGIPYKGKEAQMYIFLPKERFGLAQFEEKLNGPELLQLINECTSQEVQVSIPKFKLEKKFELVSALQKLGMTDAFGDNANFNGMSNEKLHISDVIHKAFIEVNEEGTEAAAASGIIMFLSSSLAIKPIEVYADHPFMFAIVRGEVMLFVGHFY